MSKCITKVATVKELQANKQELKRVLKDFDLILVDSGLNLIKSAKELGGGVSGFLKKKKVPFPVKISGQNYSVGEIEKNIKEAIEQCTHCLVSGGKEFLIQISKTESLATKESVKNIIQGGELMIISKLLIKNLFPDLRL